MESDLLARRFDELRPHLTSVAFHVVGSAFEAEDVVQSAWLKIASSESSSVTNLAGWFTTITARTALDVLKARRRRRESLTADAFEPSDNDNGADTEALLADSVGRALLVVLDQLSPAERVAFVLHDVFDTPFGDIGAIIDRTPSASKKLASRARAKLHTNPAETHPRTARQIQVAEETREFTARARAGAVVLIDGHPGIAIAPSGRALALITLDFGPTQRIDAIDITADRHRIDTAALTLPTGADFGGKLHQYTSRTYRLSAARRFLNARASSSESWP